MPLYSTACPLPINRKMFRHRGSVSPIPQSGLSLWLKADAGVTTVAEQFISQVVISGGGRSAMNGTYTRASGGDTSFVKTGDSNFEILWSGAEWYINGDEYYCASDDSNQTEYAYNPSYDMSSNWLISPEYGCDGTPPTGSLTLSPTGTLLATAWADQSGNGKNMTSSSGNEPTFIASELNGKPVIDFEGSKYLTASFASINFTQQTVFVVFKFVSANLSNFARPFSQSNIDYNDHETPGNFLPLLRNNNSDAMWCYSQIDGFLVGIPTSDNTWYISTTKTDGSNGSFFINASNEQAFSTTFDANITDMQVGGALIAEGGIGDPFNSKLAEVIVYDRNLTTPERQQVEAYLNTKYAIY